MKVLFAKLDAIAARFEDYLDAHNPRDQAAKAMHEVVDTLAGVVSQKGRELEDLTARVAQLEAGVRGSLPPPPPNDVQTANESSKVVEALRAAQESRAGEAAGEGEQTKDAGGGVGGKATGAFGT